jgi:hypothetical protein
VAACNPAQVESDCDLVIDTSGSVVSKLLYVHGDVETPNTEAVDFVLDMAYDFMVQLVSPPLRSLLSIIQTLTIKAETPCS